ncbi:MULTISPECIES: hypothetical protein [Flavobacterium]|uniref:Uncharacterized protein n=1 Tax=Flavobacterium ranwuense TaxID=2541725 RepID=A0ABY2DTG5_9FLAO|nr:MULTISPECIES: hypothetical protein [Flavobacterium]TDE28735.1 hypothetical protein E0I61_10085 [Flavobacterium ranwuense]TDE53073.1 hypothetical protein E0H99_10370 [Flavobacterium sp. GT3P67]
MKRLLLLLIITLTSNLYSQNFDCDKRGEYLDTEEASLKELHDAHNKSYEKGASLLSEVNSITKQLSNMHTDSYGYQDLKDRYEKIGKAYDIIVERSNTLQKELTDKISRFNKDVKEFNKKCKD